MKTMILRVKKYSAMTTVQSEKSESGVLQKRTLVLQELGGKYANAYVVTALGNLASTASKPLYALTARKRKTTAKAAPSWAKSRKQTTKS